MKSIAFISFPGHLAGLPSLGAGRASGFDDLRLQLIALRVEVAAAAARAASAVSPPPAVEPALKPAPDKARRQTGRPAARPVPRARPVYLPTGTGG